MGMCYVLLLANGNAEFERDGGPAQVLSGALTLTLLSKATSSIVVHVPQKCRLL